MTKQHLKFKLLVLLCLWTILSRVLASGTNSSRGETQPTESDLPTGVSARVYKRGTRFQAQITNVNGNKTKYLGTYDTAAEAVAQGSQTCFAPLRTTKSDHDSILIFVNIRARPSVSCEAGSGARKPVWSRFPN